MPVHSRFIQYFSETCKTGSMRLAAKNLHVTSSALNRKINDIERELGVALFNRTAAGVTLTPSGEILQRHIEQTLSDFARAKSDIQAFTTKKGGLITIAGPESVISAFLPKVLSNLHSRQDGVTTAFKAASDVNAEKLLHDRDADVVLGFDLPITAGSIEIGRCQLPVGAITAKHHPLAEKSTVTIAQCVKYPLVLPDPSWPLRSILDKMIARLECQPSILTSSNSVELLRVMIVQKLGIGFQTIIGVEPEIERGDLSFIPLIDEGSSPESLTQDFVILTRNDLADSSAGRDLFELMFKQLTQYRP